MKNILTRILIFSVILVSFESCTNDNLTPLYGTETNQPGKVVITGYSALNDSIQININGKLLTIGKEKKSAFTKKIETEYQFVYYGDKNETFEVTNKVTKQIVHTYNFTAQKPIDTLSFFAKENIWIEHVSALKPGVLTKTGNCGYKFIFPTQNLYSKSGYEGTIDGILRKINGQTIGVVENINKDKFSSFIEFPFSSPPTVLMELVKHGTTESYIPGQKVVVILTMTNNKSKLIVLDEKQDTNGVFSGVDGTLNLVDYFVFK
ncbi:hypothetical protein [Flavobacterium sp. N1736]|uniref:hypothetical protein n=1 Tax=Flavobacterium sp. N1736 TaxID=2986823 RepID=UPI002224E383|nr:hypothetical protein [Flavobacterium sp. N1736]